MGREDNKKVGKIGEEEACRYLREKGYEIVERNWGSKWGEVDIIVKTKTHWIPCQARDDTKHSLSFRTRSGIHTNIFIFVEVKTKVGEDWGMPEEMVNKRKLAQVQRMAETYEPARGYQSRLDVVAVVLNDDLSVCRLNHYECVY